MRKKVLDTNILIAHWRRFAPYADKRPSDAEQWARSLIEGRETDAIVSPVAIEFLCKKVDRHQLELAEAFLNVFRIIDEGKLVPQDWQEARRLAKHAGPRARERDLGDCLISAIADRLNHDLITDDKDLIRQRGRTRRRRR
jgi:predicted nucleic acid-binding protein